jgi:transposase
MHRVERLSIREIHRRTGLHRATVRRALASDAPPAYRRSPAGSKLDSFRDWICEQLDAEPAMPSQRLRELAGELGYAGGKTIFDDYVREVRPRFLARRTFQRTLYRPGELVQCDLWEPREPIAVGYGQLRRGWVVTMEVCWARVIAGALIFSKQAPDILWGLGRCLGRIGALPERLVWDREAAIAAGGRPTEAFAAFCGQLGVGWIILDRGDAQAKGVLERSHRYLRTNFLPGRRFANEADFQAQLDSWCDKANRRSHRTTRAVPGERLAQERVRMRPLPAVMPDVTRSTPGWPAAEWRYAPLSRRSPRSPWTRARWRAGIAACSQAGSSLPTPRIRRRWSGCAANAEAARSRWRCARSPAMTS